MSERVDREAARLLPRGAPLRRHDRAVFDLRRRRDVAVSGTADFEALREHAAALRRHTLAHLDRYLEQFERSATAAGAQVHWAADARGHNEAVYRILAARGAQRVVKSKSMLTEECGLNPYLEARGLEVVDTDLGEHIIQLGREPPSHILAPAIHRTREEIGALFHRELGGREGEVDPQRLTELARVRLRPRFLAADAGITGVNFAVAETGAVAVITNEGNADLGVSLPPLHVACMGIEKVVPSLDDLAVLLRLLARSATGQPLSVYTSLFRGPRPGAELHVVIVDNGRTRLLGDPGHRASLACIRCGACLNTCPVYRRAGGHAYGETVAGPIGSVLAPVLGRSAGARRLPHASSLCGSCTAVCPVKIDLHAQLLAWRRELGAPWAERLAARLAGAVLARPALYRGAGRLLRLAWPALRRRWPGNPASAWLRDRELPVHPGPRFATRYRRMGR